MVISGILFLAVSAASVVLFYHLFKAIIKSKQVNDFSNFRLFIFLLIADVINFCFSLTFAILCFTEVLNV